jgi:LPXTG-motif cell wall-anchored protein
VKFTISPLGEVSIDNTDGYAGVLDTDDSDQKTEYTITIINNREDLVAPTGVTNNYLPYILILLAGVMMGLLFFILKRRREDEEEE